VSAASRIRGSIQREDEDKARNQRTSQKTRNQDTETTDDLICIVTNERMDGDETSGRANVGASWVRGRREEEGMKALLP